MGVLSIKNNGKTMQKLPFSSIKKAIQYVATIPYSSNVFEYATVNTKTRIENTIVLQQRESILPYKSISNN